MQLNKIITDTLTAPYQHKRPSAKRLHGLYEASQYAPERVSPEEVQDWTP